MQLDPPPAFIEHRIKIFEKLRAEYDEAVSGKHQESPLTSTFLNFRTEKPRNDITITLDNNRNEIGKAWETTPAQIARAISKSLSERVVISKVNGELWDLERPLETDCRLELLDFEHPEGSHTNILS